MERRTGEQRRERRRKEIGKITVGKQKLKGLRELKDEDTEHKEQDSEQYGYG